MSEVNSSPIVTVVIPFFQTEQGILRGTVEAIIANTHDTAISIVVVDDGSPISAIDELRSLIDNGAPITILSQPNAGPGAARNRGLDSVSQDTSYVAFVDSDDSWVADLISDGVAALDAGHDLFFGNTVRVGVDKTRFDWQEDEGLNLDASQHIAIDGLSQSYTFAGDFFDYIVYRSNVISTSALIYRFEKARNLRFKSAIFNGQDRLFKLHLAKHLKRISFSDRVYVAEGRGVNIFDTSGWGSAKSLRFLSSYIDLAKTILREVPMNSEQRRFVRVQLHTSRYNFAVSLVHLMRHGGEVKWATVSKTFLQDPATLLLLGPNLGLAAIAKLKKLTP